MGLSLTVTTHTRVAWRQVWDYRYYDEDTSKVGRLYTEFRYDTIISVWWMCMECAVHVLQMS